MSDKQPLHSQLYAVMAQRILSGEWPEGEKVPTEMSLVREFGTSRGPVRQALSKLRAEGLIVGGRGSPPRVQRSVPSQPFDTYMSFTEWALELGRVPGQKTIEVTRRLADEALAAQLKIPVGAQIVQIVRLRCMDAEAVMLETTTLPVEFGQHLLDVDLDAHSIYQTLLRHDIYPIRSRNVISSVAAGDFEAHWLGVPEGSPLLRVQRVSYNEQGLVVDVSDNRYEPSKATFTVENTRAHPSPVSRVVPPESEG